MATPWLAPLLTCLLTPVLSLHVQVSDTHRLDDNKAEKKRCEDAGFEVCRSTVDGKPVGPVRVWPGGLAMSRTIGDHMVRSFASSSPKLSCSGFTYTWLAHRLSGR